MKKSVWTEQGSSNRDHVLAQPHFVRRQKKRTRNRGSKISKPLQLSLLACLAYGPVTTLMADLENPPRVGHIQGVGVREPTRFNHEALW